MEKETSVLIQGPARNCCLWARGDLQINKIVYKLTEEKQKYFPWWGWCAEEMREGELRIRRTSTHANTPGRLRARSGSKLPSATGPLRALGMVDLPRSGCLGLSAGCCARQGATNKYNYTAIWFTVPIFKKYDFACDFLQKYKQIWRMTPGGTKNEKIERQGYQKVSQRAPKVSQKAAKGR